MRRHIDEVLANGNASYADYIIKWAAWKFQHPAMMPRVAMFFRGDEGRGKGVFCRSLVTAFGAHGQRVQSVVHVAGRFNSHMRHCCLLYADELRRIGDEQEGTFKGMITEPTLPMEAKGVDIIHVENHLGIVGSSNQDFFIPAGSGARRFAIFDTSSAHKGDASYFEKLYAEIEHGGMAAMLHELLAMPLGNWHPEAQRPDTAALDDQKSHNLPPMQRCWLLCLNSGTIPCGEELSNGKVFLPSELFTNIINDRLKLRDKEQVTNNQLQILFKKMNFVKDDTSRPRGWHIAPLPEARQAWNDEMKMNIEWDGATGWQAHTISGEKVLAELDDNVRGEAYMQSEIPF